MRLPITLHSGENAQKGFVMNAHWKRLLVLADDQRGGSLVEYVIVVALVAAAGVGAWQSFGQDIKKYTEDAHTEIGGKIADSQTGE
jgi:Flp pilus assembly pilin Flp